MEKKYYAVHRMCNIVGYNDTYYVLAENKKEALRLAFPYDYLEPLHKFFRYYVEEYA
jgi:hypothetical protein